MPNFLEEKISTDLKEEQLRHEEKQPRTRRKKISTKHTAWTRKKKGILWYQSDRDLCKVTQLRRRKHFPGFQNSQSISTGVSIISQN